MYQIECQREIKQIQETLQKDKNLLGTTLSRIFDSEARIQKLQAKLKEKQSAKMADWKNPEFDAARLSICAASSR
jgi:vacuolar-type H+-ATPase subunit I/STV1